MVFCSECGKNYQDSGNFCPYCGTPNSLSAGGSNQAKPADVDTDINSAPAFQTVKRNNTPPYGAYRLEDLQKGFVIDDRYEVKKKLGQGGFGTVYLVNDRTLDINKALKIFPNVLGNDPEAVRDLQKEAQTLMKLTHDSIVRIYDLHLTGSIKYLDMEYIEGKPLNELKLEYDDKKVPEDMVIEIAKKIINGLSYAHQNKIIHKDIKPHNIMLLKDGNIKIMDFGIAENIRSSMSRIANSASSGTLVYMSPEQVRGEDIGPESDIYSFGAMLYELLSGHPPFFKGDIHYQIINQKPKDISDISQKLNPIIQKFLEKDFKDRYRSFKEVKDILSPQNIQEIVEESQNERMKRILKPVKDKVLFNKGEIEHTMILVDGGDFKMGNNNGKNDERPVHLVTLSDFYICKYEVTQGLYSKIIGSNPSYFKKGDIFPLEQVNWYDAVKFCNKLSGLYSFECVYTINGNDVKFDFSKNGYRLPTEAEWEYAARGGTKSKDYYYPGSNDADDVAWHGNNSGGETNPVGKKRANELGLYDMSGNVYEWCWDRYKDYNIRYQDNPQGASSGSNRVIRGGSCISSITATRSTSRFGDSPESSNMFQGLRLARSAV